MGQTQTNAEKTVADTMNYAEIPLFRRNWKRWVVIGLSIGIGVVIAAFLLWWLVTTYQNRPTEAKTWPVVTVQGANLKASLKTRWKGGLRYQFLVEPISPDFKASFDRATQDGSNYSFTLIFYDKAGFKLCEADAPSITRILPVQWTIVSVGVLSVARSSFGRGTELAAIAGSSRLNDSAFTVGGILALARFRPNYRQPRMSPTSLQQTLDKIVFAQQVSMIIKMTQKSRNKVTSVELQQALAESRLEFTVADFSTGTVASIMNRPLGELLTGLPNFRTLDVSSGDMQVSNEHGVVGHHRLADVQWQGGDIPSGPQTSQWSTRTFADAVKETPRYGTCTGYFTASITATFKGETEQWRPLYLTGCEGGMVALDPVMVVSQAVPDFWDADIYPYILLGDPRNPRIRNAAVQEWLHAHASETCTGNQVCYENGGYVTPKDKIPLVTPQAGIQPPNKSDGLTCPDSEQEKLRAQASIG